MSQVLMMDQSFSQCLALANEYAYYAKQKLGSMHLFLSVFAFKNSTRELLRKDWDITEDRILNHLKSIQAEDKKLIHEIYNTLSRSVSNPKKDILTAAHLVQSLLKLRNCQAYRILLTLGLPVSAIRQKIRQHANKTIARECSEILTLNKFQTMCNRPMDQIGSYFENNPESTINLTSLDETNPEIELSQTSKKEEIEAEQIFEENSFDLSTPFSLDEDKFPTLWKNCRNLTELAFHGEINDVIGRKKELDQVVQILGKIHSNNPCLIGYPGVGKTAIVEGLAKKIVANEFPKNHSLTGKKILELSIGQILSDTSLRGSLSKKIQTLIKEVKASKKEIILFIDEIHTLLMGDDQDGSSQIAQELKTVLARGEFPCIGATTFEEYQKYFNKDPALNRRFSKIEVSEPFGSDLRTIIEGAIERYESGHGVNYPKNLIDQSIKLSDRFIHDRYQPDKTFAVLDHSGSLAKLKDRKELCQEDIFEAISSLAKIPLDFIEKSNQQRVLTLEKDLGNLIFGQNEAIAQLCKAIKRNYAGFANKHHLGAFLFYGPHGVGNTELALMLSEKLFGDQNNLIRLDMSEYSSEASTFKLLGAPAGHVGYGDGGVLTNEVMQKPYSIVLFDEIEKAHEKVKKCLLQILDNGRLKDSMGRQVSFKNTIIIATMALNSDEENSSRTIGFGQNEHKTSSFSSDSYPQITEKIGTDLSSRFTAKIPFRSLDAKAFCRIIGKELKSTFEVFEENNGIHINYSETLPELLFNMLDPDPSSGARNIRTFLSDKVENLLADNYLANKLVPFSKYLLNSSESSELEIIPN